MLHITSANAKMLIRLTPQLQTRLGLSSQELIAFCQKWGVIHLSLFGSILRDDFQDDSDIDILLSFASNRRQGLLTLAKIKHELEALLNRPVDIVLKDSIITSENWIRKQEILSTAQTIYEQR